MSKNEPTFQSINTPPDSLAQSELSESSSLPPSSRRNWRFATECATVENPSPGLRDQHGSSSVPIYQTATFKGMPGGQFDYSRSGNPTRSFLEHHLKKISAAASAHAVGSGMSALDLILRLVKPGDTVLAGDDLYGGTNRLLGWLGTDGGVTVHHCDTSNASALAPYLIPGQNKVTMVLLESPTNPMLKIADIAAVVAVVRAGAPDALIVADNTMMSPYLQRPLDLGVDICYDSGTKFLSGHHDLMAGIVTARTEEIGKRLSWFVNAMGTALAPFDCFLLLRGLKTLPLRMDRQQASCNLIATYLHTLGFKVHYPGLKADPGHELHFKQATGAGGVMSFETGDTVLSEGIVSGTRIWGISVSFGAVNSLISMPCLMSHASIPAHLRAERGLPEDLIRLCIGIEDPHDLIDDLETSLLDSGAIRSRPSPNSIESFHATPTPLHANEEWVIQRAKTFERVRPSASDITDALAKANLAETTPKEVEEEIAVSAPGKVILFGEHAVVHGVTGIAASVDLRCYAVLKSTPAPSGSTAKVTLNLPDLAFSQSWDSSVLPWELAPSWSVDTAPSVLDPVLFARVEELAEGAGAGPRERVSVAAFLYLLVLLGAGRDQSSLTFTARSALPMGAGLGSSAAYSTCISLALLLHHRLVSPPHLPAPSSATHTHISHSGRRAIGQPAIEIVDRWAFLSEKVIHGNPSGIDNAVSVRGGAVAFRKSGFPDRGEGGMEGMKSFKSVRFLITDSKVGRDTKSLVAGVGKRLVEEPEVIVPLLDAIQAVCDEAKRCLSDAEMGRAELVAALEALVSENHLHLRLLGVSHPVLERILALTSAAPYNLHTKLTGAGGGGCAVTLLPDELSPESLEALMGELRAEGWAPYVANVGGSGVGMLHPEGRSKVTRVGGLEGGLKGVGEVDGLDGWAREGGKWGFA